METQQEIRYFDWLDLYRPVRNHIDNNASFDGLMFETFGPEVDYVGSVANSADHAKVWTLLDSGDVVSGYHLVNRMGYFITEVPCPAEQSITAPFEDDHIPPLNKAAA